MYAPGVRTPSIRAVHGSDQLCSPNALTMIDHNASQRFEAIAGHCRLSPHPITLRPHLPDQATLHT
jgi:hypothetical protein